MSFQKVRYSKSNVGMSLVEVVVGTALILIALIGLVNAYSFYLKAGFKNTDELKASFLLQEGVEGVTLIRDDGWGSLSALTSGTPYFLSWNGTKWVATTTEVLVGGMFRRTVTLEDVYRRDSDKDIVATTSVEAKSLDPFTKKLTVVVSGTTASTTKTETVTYLTNLFE